MPTGVDDFQTLQPVGHGAELRRKLADADAVAQPSRVVTVPVPFAVGGVLTVVAEHDDPPGTPVSGQQQRAGAGVAAKVADQLLGPLAEGGDRQQTPGKAGVGFGVVHPPPGRIHRIQHVSPGSEAESGIGYDDGSAFLRRPPLADFFDVCFGETGAAGDADNFTPEP